MKVSRLLLPIVVALPLAANSLHAQTLQEEVVRDLRGIAEKVVGLAMTVPESDYSWSPAQDVRSIGDVYMHIASANFRFPGMLGHAPPSSAPEHWVRGEADGVDRETVVAAVNASFDFMMEVVEGIDDLDAPVNVFGRQTNARGFLTVMSTHLHEHLGQSIAYARTNGIVPPWSGMQP